MSTEKSETNLLSLLEVAKATWPLVQPIGQGAKFHDWCQTLFEGAELKQLRIIAHGKQPLGIMIASNDGDGTLTVKELVCLVPGVMETFANSTEEFYGPVNTVRMKRRGKFRTMNFKKFLKTANKFVQK